MKFWWTKKNEMKKKKEPKKMKKPRFLFYTETKITGSDRQLIEILIINPPIECKFSLTSKCRSSTILSKIFFTNIGLLVNNLYLLGRY